MTVRGAIAHSEASLGWGGQEHRVMTELVGFSLKGLTTKLAASRESGISARAKAAGIHTAYFNYRRIEFPIELFKATRWLSKSNIQILNTHSSRDGWLMGVAGRIARTPLIIRSRHIEVEYPNAWVSRHAFKTFADLVITTSDRITTGLRGALNLSRDRVMTVPTGIDIERFKPRREVAPRYASGISDWRPVVGMVSVLRSWKGHAIFLKAIKLLLHQGIDLRGIIVGEGPQKQNIEKSIDSLSLVDDVHMTGHVENVHEVLQDMDLLIIPSTDHEGIPQIGLQSLACGTPVIGSNVGGIPEIIKDKITGRIVPAADPHKLADSIKAALLEKIITRQYAKAGLELVRKHHTVDCMLNRLDSIYQSFLQTKIRKPN